MPQGKDRPRRSRSRSTESERRTTAPPSQRRRQDSTSPSPPPSLREHVEWVLLQDRSVMALTPTPAMVAAARTTDAGGVLRIRVAAFDLDETLVRYRRESRAVASRAEPEPWSWVQPCVPTHVRALHDHGYLIALFSNQAGIGGLAGGWREAAAEAIRRKIVAVAAAMEVPVVAYVSTTYDRWRKPMPGMWGQLQEDLSAASAGASAAAIDCHTLSFYVGDAAGRVPGPGRTKRDFSCSDRRFAHNLGLPFYTPTEFFAGFPDSHRLCSDGDGGPCLSAAFLSTVAQRPAEKFEWGGVSPAELRAIPSSYAGLTVQRITARGGAPYVLPTTAPFFLREDAAGGGRGSSRAVPSPQELVLLVGPPSCGKSTFYCRHLKPLGFAHVNRDTLGTRERCLRAVEQLWRAGHSVAVDNTNPTRSDRRAYVDLVCKLMAAGARPPVAAAAALPVHFIVLDCSKALALHLNAMRARLGQAAGIPTVAYHTYFSRYEAVTAAEVEAANITCAWVLPPVMSFDDLPPQTRREFYVLS